MATEDKPLVLSSSSDSDTDSDINEAIRSQNKKRYNAAVDEAQEVVEDGVVQQQRNENNKEQTDDDLSPDKKPLKKSNSSGDILSPNFSGMFRSYRLVSSICISYYGIQVIIQK